MKFENLKKLVEEATEKTLKKRHWLMRKDISAKETVLREALTRLGYVKCNKQESFQEWRHRQFHLFIRKRGKRGITLNIHEDTATPLPPFHKAKHKTKTLKQEITKIMDAYLKLKATK